MCTSVTHISLISPAAIGKAITRSLPPAQERVCWVDGPVVFTHFFEKGLGIHFFVVDSEPSTARTPRTPLSLTSDWDWLLLPPVFRVVPFLTLVITLRSSPHRHDHGVVHAIMVACRDGAWGARGGGGEGRGWTTYNVQTHPAAAKAAKQWAAASPRALGGAKILLVLFRGEWCAQQ